MDLSTASTQTVLVPVTATILGAPYDPTGDAVALAFLANGVTPSSGDWHAATWQTFGGANYAACLVGPANGGVVLAMGTWTTWVRVTDNPEVPVMQAGYLNVK